MKYIIRSKKNALGGPIEGQILCFEGDKIPDGYFECNGQRIGRIENLDLFKVIGESYEPKFIKKPLRFKKLRRLFGLKEFRLIENPDYFPDGKFQLPNLKPNWREMP